MQEHTLTLSSTDFSQNLSNQIKTMPALAISIEREMYTCKIFRTKKSNSEKFNNDIAESNFYDDFTFKTHINLLHSMLSRTLTVMFKAKKLRVFTKNYLLLLHMTLFLVYFNRFVVICCQILKVSKAYQNNQETSINKLI